MSIPLSEINWRKVFDGAIRRESRLPGLESRISKCQTICRSCDRASQEFSKKKFSRKDDLALFKTTATATATAGRDLKHGVDSGLLQKQGEKAQTAYEFRKP